MMCETVGNACLRGAGDTITGLVAMTLTNVVNLILSWSLAVGFGPFKPMGWDGIAIGTTCGFVVGGLVVLANVGIRVWYDQNPASLAAPLALCSTYWHFLLAVWLLLFLLLASSVDTINTLAALCGF